jgi:hypothetical protein
MDYGEDIEVTNDGKRKYAPEPAKTMGKKSLFIGQAKSAFWKQN